MPFEVELKAWLVNRAEIEMQVAQLGTFKKETLKEDVYFRFKDDLAAVNHYRLRQEEGQNTVTFKHRNIMDGIEINDETEFGVDDAQAFFKFAARFGFEPFVVKRKKSRVYQVGRANVEFNEVEHLGHFIEIEIICYAESELLLTRTEIARLFNQVGVAADALEPRPYTYLIQKAHPVQYRFVDDDSLVWPFEEVSL